ncbi:MAG: N-acetylmuramoyl-L-alanine amidase [Phaeodactylibacter sp.]|nr:N-acetylmuramoyl-L-alanine amidase [Phaeodactylibacter sp.]
MTQLVPILDFGHGGIINGAYQTSGKRSPDWHHGVLYEGVSNRKFGRRIMELLDYEDIPYYTTGLTEQDTSLRKRVNIANSLFAKDPRAYVLSIHSNAGGGTGLEAFTSPGETRSDAVATQMLTDLKVAFPEEKHRHDWSDDDPDKEAEFYILTRTKCPAVLAELWFMDNMKDYNTLFDPDMRERAAVCLFETIKSLYRGVA